jgi:hypothetical protein
METQALNKYLHKYLLSVPERLSLIIKLRYGLEGEKLYLPEEIAKKLNLTSQRVIELEAKSIRKLRSPQFAKPLMRSFESLEHEIWVAISDNVNDHDSIVPREGYLNRITKKLHGEILLAMNCMFGNIEGWLSSYACQTDFGWFRSKYPKDIVLNTLSKFREMDWETFLPIPAKIFLEKFEMGLDLIELIFALNDNVLGNYRGYIAQRPLSTIDMRSIRSHMILLYQYSNELVPYDQIIESYNSIYDDDKLTLEILISIVKAKYNIFHLVGVDGKGYSAKGTVDDVKPYDDFMEESDSDENQTRFIFNRPWSETSARSLIKEILETNGICTRKEINRLFLEKTSHRFAAADNEVPVVTAVLCSEPNILELAPSLFGLKEKFNNLDRTMATSDLLLTARDCRRFVVARYAGELLNTYSLWTPAMEYKWCAWIETKISNLGNDKSRKFYHKHSNYRKLFESLLYISDPDFWPISEDEKILWRFKKQTLGLYHYKITYHDQNWESLPSLQDLFLVAQLTKQLEYINYIRINKALMNARTTSPTSVTTLSLLILLEIISPSENWQQKHKIGPRIDEQIATMIQEIKGKGFLHWDDDIGVSFRQQIGVMESRKDLGWVDTKSIQIILNILGGRHKTLHMDKTRKKEDAKEDDKKDGFKISGYRQIELPF